MVIALLHYGFELRLIYGHMYVCNIETFLHQTLFLRMLHCFRQGNILRNNHANRIFKFAQGMHISYLQMRFFLILHTHNETNHTMKKNQYEPFTSQNAFAQTIRRCSTDSFLSTISIKYYFIVLSQVIE